MTMSNAATKRSKLIDPAPIGYEPRSAVYGGLVGQMINEIDSRLISGGAIVEHQEAREDFIHAISVACGYIGLLAGFAAASAGLFLLL